MDAYLGLSLSNKANLRPTRVAVENGSVRRAQSSSLSVKSITPPPNLIDGDAPGSSFFTIPELEPDPDESLDCFSMRLSLSLICCS